MPRKLEYVNLIRYFTEVEEEYVERQVYQWKGRHGYNRIRQPRIKDRMFAISRLSHTIKFITRVVRERL